MAFVRILRNVAVRAPQLDDLSMLLQLATHPYLVRQPSHLLAVVVVRTLETLEIATEFLSALQNLFPLDITHAAGKMLVWLGHLRVWSSRRSTKHMASSIRRRVCLDRDGDQQDSNEDNC